MPFLFLRVIGYHVGLPPVAHITTDADRVAVHLRIYVFTFQYGCTGSAKDLMKVFFVITLPRRLMVSIAVIDRRDLTEFRYQMNYDPDVFIVLIQHISRHEDGVRPLPCNLFDQFAVIFSKFRIMQIRKLNDPDRRTDVGLDGIVLNVQKKRSDIVIQENQQKDPKQDK